MNVLKILGPLLVALSMLGMAVWIYMRFRHSPDDALAFIAAVVFLQFMIEGGGRK